MARRDVIRLALTAAPAAQRTTAVPPRSAVRIAVLLPVNGSENFVSMLRDGLRELGRTEDDKLKIDVAQADGTVEAFLRLGRELSSHPVDVLVTASAAAAQALAKVTSKIPIVFVGAFDPIAAGLVASLDHPGHNLTGIAGFRADIAEDWASLLSEIAPKVQRCGIFYNPASMPPAALAAFRSAAERRMRVSDFVVKGVEEIEKVAATAASDPHTGLMVVPHTFAFANRARVVEAMARHGVPAIYGIAEMVRTGGLLSYGQNLSIQWRMSAVYVDQIIRGARPADLPVRYAPRYALAINLTAAANLGLTPPSTLIKRADEVVA